MGQAIAKRTYVRRQDGSGVYFEKLVEGLRSDVPTIREDAFAELYRQSRRAVRATILHTGIRDPDLQEDVAQEIYMEAMRKIDQLTIPPAIFSWLMKTAYRLSINFALKRKRQTSAVTVRPMNRTAGSNSEPADKDGETPIERLMKAETAETVLRALQEIDERSRLVLSAFYIEGLSIIEISERLNAPVGTIKRQLHVARKRLEKRLENMFGQSL